MPGKDATSLHLFNYFTTHYSSTKLRTQIHAPSGRLSTVKSPSFHGLPMPHYVSPEHRGTTSPQCPQPGLSIWFGRIFAVAPGDVQQGNAIPRRGRPDGFVDLLQPGSPCGTCGHANGWEFKIRDGLPNCFFFSRSF